MNTHAVMNQAPRQALTLLAAALLAAFGPAWAEDAAPPSADELRKDLYTPGSRVSLGVGHVSQSNHRFGVHNGMADGGPFSILNIDAVQRDQDTGTWVRLRARNLGLDTREMRLGVERQGDWGFFIENSQFSRREPFVVNTGLQGLGTGNQVVSATAPKRDVELRMDRDTWALGARKFVAGKFDIQLSFKQDEGKGDRMMGRGTTNVMEFITEPIDRVTRQWSASIGYADKALQFSAGYGGSSYTNNIPVLTSTGGNNAANVFGAAWVMALPPSNDSHQAFLSAGYNFSSTTRASLKLSTTHSRQNTPFDPVFVRLAGAPESLDGKLDTTLAYADLSMRPTRELDLVATLRWEDRDDKTPESRFLTDTRATVGGSFGTAGVTGLYKPRSLTQTKATLDAGYRLGGGYKTALGAEHEVVDRSVSDKYRRQAFRAQTTENTARVDFKRTGQETFNAGVALLHSERTGSEYILDTYDPNALTNQVNALTWADRLREKLRVSADWLPNEEWSLQVLADFSRDTYSGRALGPRQGTAWFVSGDASYRISERWNVTAWASMDQTRAKQRTRSDRVGAVAQGYDQIWAADIRYTTTAAGFSVKGKPSARVDLGLDLGASTNHVEHILAQVGGAGTLGVPSLPNMFYKQLGYKATANYELNRQAGLRLEAGMDRRRTDDWTWTNWVYNGSPAVAVASRTSDGTTVRSEPFERVAYLGLVYHVRWR